MNTPAFSTRFALAALGVAVTTLAVGLAFSNAQTPSRPLGPNEMAVHVLNRLAFGPRPGQVAEVAQTGWRKWVEKQLHPESIDDSATEQLVRDRCPSLAMSLTELMDDPKDQQKRNKIRRDRKEELIDSVILRAASSNRQFQEVMVEFWRNHFNVDFNKVPMLAGHFEENVIRVHCFGKFEDLLLATAKHPAMLVYLDNSVSRARGLNENYARELMELHTLGVDNGYTQKDVVALARVLTGWTVGWRPGASGREYGFVFEQRRHDYDPANVVGLELSGRKGMADGEAAIRHLAHHEGTAQFIVTKLCRYLVGDQPPQSLVDKVVAVFQKSGGDLRETYRAIVFSPEFGETKAYRSKFKTPFDFVISTLRIADAKVNASRRLAHELRLMGQPIYECVEPTGYSDAQEAWLDPGVLVYRWNLAIQLVTDKLPGVKVGSAFTDKVLKPSTQTGRARAVIDQIMPFAYDSRTERLVSQSNDLRTMIALALGSPSFQQQ